MKVKIVTNHTIDIGSARIRVFNLISELKNLFEDISVSFISEKFSIDNVDIVIFQKTIDYKLLYECRKKGIYTCFDIDDLFTQYNKMIKYVDLVIVSTEHLRKVLLKYNKNIVIVPNSLDIENINCKSTSMHNNNSDISFAWYGWSVNSKILDKINIREDVTTISEKGDIIYNRETIDSDLQKFSYIIIPQNKTQHTLCKTNCRFLKAVYLGIPCLISDMPEYLKLAEEINYPHEYIVDDLKKFKPLMEKIKNNQIELPKIDFEKAKEIIAKNYNSKVISEIFYKEIFESYSNRNILNEKFKTIRYYLVYKKPLQQLLSLTNQGNRKVISFLGVKFKFKSKKLEQKNYVLKLQKDLSIMKETQRTNLRMLENQLKIINELKSELNNIKESQRTKLGKFENQLKIINENRFEYSNIKLRQSFDIPRISEYLANGIKFPHLVGIVISRAVDIGENCVIYQNVTIGAKTNESGDYTQTQNYPIIGNNVKIYAGAIIIGPIKIGDNAIIGANSIIMADVPANETVTGIWTKNKHKIINIGE